MFKVMATAKNLILFLWVCISCFSVLHSKNISEFVTNSYHAEGLSPEVRQNLVQKGYDLLRRLQAGEALPEQTEIFSEEVLMAVRKKSPSKTSQNVSDFELVRRAKLENIIAIVWALADYGSRIDSVFASGAFSVVEADEKLSKLFEEYVLYTSRLKDLKKLSNGVFVSINPWANKFVYNRHPRLRASSHYKKGLTTYQFGIDARFAKNGPSLPVFPFKTRHLLVGRVKTFTGLPKTFVKYESYGSADINSAINHLNEFMQVVKFKTAPLEKRSEKKIRPELLTAFAPLKQALMALPDKGASFLYPSLTNMPSIDGRLAAKAFDAVFKDRKYKAAGKSYDLATLSLMAALSYRFSQDEIIKRHAAGFLNALEDRYHDGSVTSAVELTIQQALRTDSLLFYRTGNEVVLNLRNVTY